MAGIFISYRRQDTTDLTGRLGDRLRGQYGKDTIFTDIDSIPVGVDFREHIDRHIRQCDVLIAVIGKNWLGASDSGALRKIDEEKDFVRTEIEAALNRKIPVIPLVSDASDLPSASELPDSIKKLAFLNAALIRPDPDFHKDADRLISELNKHYSINQKKSALSSFQPGSLDIDIAYYIELLETKRTKGDLESMARKLFPLIQKHPNNHGLARLKDRLLEELRAYQPDWDFPQSKDIGGIYNSAYQPMSAEFNLASVVLTSMFLGVVFASYVALHIKDFNEHFGVIVFWGGLITGVAGLISGRSKVRLIVIGTIMLVIFVTFYALASVVKSQFALELAISAAIIFFPVVSLVVRIVGVFIGFILKRKGAKGNATA